MTRRTLLQLMPSAAAMAQTSPEAPGRLKPRPSRSVASSRISIGFETLDRGMFDPERCYPYLAETGVKWARCQTGWARTEKQRGEFDFAWLDGVVDSLRGMGIQPWFNVGYGNRLYSPEAAHETAVGWAPLANQEARQAWVRYVERLGSHFAGRVKHYEIWNEPHHVNFWKPGKPDPAAYVELVRLTAPALRKASPGCVLIGGCFPVGNFRWIEGCFEAGLAQAVDKISFHPYRAIPEEHYRGDVRALEALVGRYRPGMALWQGESGAPSDSGGTGALANIDWDEVKQAKWLTRRLLIDLALGLELVSYFHTVDMANYVGAEGASTRTNYKGVLRAPGYTPKSSYFALQNVCALFDGETANADFVLRVESPERRVETASFVRRGVPVYAFWYPADLQAGWRTQRARVTVWSGGAARLERPVLVDLVRGTVERVEGTERGGMTSFEAALRDYPMVLTGEAAVAGAA